MWCIAHDRVERSITLSMPGYVEKLLQRFEHLGLSSMSGVNSPTVYTPPSYGKSTVDESPLLSDADITTIQEIIGGVLFLCLSRRSGYCC